MVVSEVLEYLNKGITHYEEEIDVLNTKSEKSTKYMYNKGALDALNNMKVFLETYKKNSTPIVETPISSQNIEAVIPTLFELDKKFYENLVANAQPIFLKIENTYHIVGECKIGIVNNLIYISGKLFNSKLLENHNAIIISEVNQFHVLELVKSNVSNIRAL